MSNSKLNMIFIELPIGGLSTLVPKSNVVIPAASAHMLEHLFFKNGSKVFELFLKNNITIFAYTKHFKTIFTMVTSGDNLTAYKLFCEQLNNFEVSERAFCNEKKIVVLESECEERKLNVFDIQRKELLCKMFGGNSNRSIVGNREEINSLNISMLQEIKEKCYSNANVSAFFYDSKKYNINNLSLEDKLEKVYFDKVNIKQNYTFFIIGIPLKSCIRNDDIELFMFLLFFKHYLLMEVKARACRMQVSQKIEYIQNELIYELFLLLPQNINSTFLNEKNFWEINIKAFELLKDEVISNEKNKLIVNSINFEDYYILARIGCNINEFLDKLEHFSYIIFCETLNTFHGILDKRVII